MASSALVAPSFNGRTAASGAAYRGSNPWGAANQKLPRTSPNRIVHHDIRGNEMAPADHILLLCIVDLIELSCSRGPLSYEQALAVVYAAVDEAITRDGIGGSKLFKPHAA